MLKHYVFIIPFVFLANGIAYSMDNNNQLKDTNNESTFKKIEEIFWKNSNNYPMKGYVINDHNNNKKSSTLSMNYFLEETNNNSNSEEVVINQKGR